MAALPSALARALKTSRGALIGVGVFSAFVNVLTLTSAFYMLQVYDRVLPSRSIPTLVGLSLLAGILFAGQGVFDFLRSRILLRVARSFDEHLSPHVFPAIARLPLLRRGGGEGLQPLRDLDQIRSFFASGGPVAFFDLPWLPLYLGICFAFHPLVGIAALSGACVLASLTLLTDVLTRARVRAAAAHGASRHALAEASRRNAEVLAAMGMTGRMAAAWGEENRRHIAAHEQAADVTGALSGLSRMVRIMLQSAVLGLGAWLVIKGEASPGIIIASSIVAARALAPVEGAIAHWKGFIGARQSWYRLKDMLASLPPDDMVLPLHRPNATLSVENLAVAPPGEMHKVVRNVSFILRRGSALGIIGPSASGKSSLARALVGVWKPAWGCVRLDSAALDQWAPEALGRHIGYLPQDIALFDGTVAQNIARLDPAADPDAILKAAATAGAHDMILRLPKGYDTTIGEGGMTLSAGQRQRIGLARALYGEPFLVVLDEPNSNLDAEGEQALTQAIDSVRQRGAIVIVIAHRPSAVAAVDLMMVMADGLVQAIGPKEEVMRKVLRPVASSPQIGPVPMGTVPQAGAA